MYPPTIVRGNASEIIALDAMWGLATSDSVTSGTRPAGVEAVDEVDAAIEAAQRMARHLAKHSPSSKGAISASLLYNRASEIAEQESNGPGSFQVALLDALWNVTAEQVAASEIIED